MYLIELVLYEPVDVLCPSAYKYLKYLIYRIPKNTRFLDRVKIRDQMIEPQPATKPNPKRSP